MPIEEEVHLIRDLLKIGNWIVNILHRHFLRVGVAVLLTRKSLVELPWLLLSLDFYAWCVRFLVNRFDLLEDVAAILESMLWVKRADEMVGLKKKIALMILDKIIRMQKPGLLS